MSQEQSSAVFGRTETHGFSFSGNAREYFGIWIVNLLLSILTVGIYTAWAKVRRLRYFYGNTWLDGHNFEYHARPTQILIGRIIAVVALVFLNVIAEFFPLAFLAFLVSYLLALPWLINKAFQFNSRMTSYRNVRFGFTGNYLKALWVFIVLPVVIPLTLFAMLIVYMVLQEQATANLDTATLIVIGIFSLLIVAAFIFVYPYVSKKVNEYIANGLSFGTAKFEAELPLGKLYRNLGFVSIPVVVVLAVASAIAYFSLSSIDTATGVNPGMQVGSVQLASLAFYVTLMASYLAYSAGVRNIAYNATRLGGVHQLASDIPRYGYAWVMISNLALSIITIGLMIPWAAVRTWRYKANHTMLVTSGDLESFTADQSEKGNVAAAEYLDIDGIDFGL